MTELAFHLMRLSVYSHKVVKECRTQLTLVVKCGGKKPIGITGAKPHK